LGCLRSRGSANSKRWAGRRTASSSTRADADEIRARLGEAERDDEVVWARRVATAAPPPGYGSAGYEPSYVTGDHFSASCDCMPFPRWHGTDEAGDLFRTHVRRLNRAGLFGTPEHAEEFLRYYLSFDWTATGQDHTTEVFLAERAGPPGQRPGTEE
jgi:hypothetical protein